MKTLTTLLIGIFYCLYGYTQTDSSTAFNGWTAHNLNGKVKTLTIRSYLKDIIPGHSPADIPKFLTHIYRFSDEGEELIYKISSDTDVVAVSIPIMQNGKIAGATNVYMRENRTENWTVRSTLLNFFAGELDCYENDKLTKRALNTINDKGHQTSLKIFDNTDRLMYEKQLEYDKRNNVIHIEECTKQVNEPDIRQTTNYRYIRFDKHNNWTERIDSSESKTLRTIRIIEYYK